MQNFGNSIQQVLSVNWRIMSCIALNPIFTIILILIVLILTRTGLINCMKFCRNLKQSQNEGEENENSNKNRVYGEFKAVRKVSMNSYKENALKYTRKYLSKDQIQEILRVTRQNFNYIKRLKEDYSQ
ncbi:unnamed protein product [Moneuplotes crassus]|uniref:Uncharacterized protein n=1 Tax=Euplotes crassus TaxID=5936 RepID=A0AAD2D722_EUPCR|nr:unnamed protein product [Moneuplotes crassus]